MPPSEEYRRHNSRPDLDHLARVHRGNASIAEQKLWIALRGRRFEGLKFRRQHPIRRFIADFACTELNLIIEVDGESHDDTAEADEARTKVLNSLSFDVLRVKTQDVLYNFDGVRRVIFDCCAPRVRTPSP